MSEQINTPNFNDYSEYTSIADQGGGRSDANSPWSKIAGGLGTLGLATGFTPLGLGLMGVSVISDIWKNHKARKREKEETIFRNEMIEKNRKIFNDYGNDAIKVLQKYETGGKVLVSNLPKFKKGGRTWWDKATPWKTRHEKFLNKTNTNGEVRVNEPSRSGGGTERSGERLVDTSTISNTKKSSIEYDYNSEKEQAGKIDSLSTDLAGYESDVNKFYRDEINKPYTETKAGKGILTTLNDKQEDELRAVNNNAIATGATHQAKLAKTEQLNDSYAKTLRNLAQVGEQRSNSLRSQYFSNLNNIMNNKQNIMGLDLSLDKMILDYKGQLAKANAIANSQTEYVSD